MMAKSVRIALGGAVALGLMTATFSAPAMAADAKPAKIRCGKLDKASQEYKDCKAKQAAARKAKKTI